jgi:hypothetical protein
MALFLCVIDWHLRIGSLCCFCRLWILACWVWFAVTGLVHQLGRICTGGGSGPTVDVQGTIRKIKMKNTFSNVRTKSVRISAWKPHKYYGNAYRCARQSLIKRHNHPESTTPRGTKLTSRKGDQQQQSMHWLYLTIKAPLDGTTSS